MEGRDAVLVSPWCDAGGGIAGAAVAPGDVEESAVGGCPSLLDEAGKHERGLPTERRAFHVDPERYQLLAHARFQAALRRCVLGQLGGYHGKTHRGNRRRDADIKIGSPLAGW